MSAILIEVCYLINFGRALYSDGEDGNYEGSPNEINALRSERSALAGIDEVDSVSRDPVKLRPKNTND